MKRSIYSRRQQNCLHVSQVQSSHYRHKAIEDSATKIKTTIFNSGSLFQLFTKISTHENNPLNGSHFCKSLLILSAFFTTDKLCQTCSSLHSGQHCCVRVGETPLLSVNSLKRCQVTTVNLLHEH